VVRDPDNGTILAIRGRERDTLAAPARGELLSGSAVSSDAQRLYYARRNTGGAWVIVERNLSSSRERVVPGTEGGLRPELSPDGGRLLFARRRGASTELVLLSLADGATRVVARGITHDESNGGGFDDVVPRHTFAADGRSALFTREGRIEAVDLQTGRERTIPFVVHVQTATRRPFRAQHTTGADTLRPRVLRYPALARGDTSLIFEAVGKLWITQLPAGVPRRLTTSPDDVLESAPAFSSDGRLVAFAAWTDGGGYLAMVSAAGGDPVRVTQAPGRYLNPAWSP